MVQIQPEMNGKINKVLLFTTMIMIVVTAITIDRCNRGPSVVLPLGPETHGVNKTGDSVALIKGFEAQFALREQRIIDSLAKVYGIRVKNLQEYILASIKSTTDIKPGPGTEHIEYLPVKNDCPRVVKYIRSQFNTPWDSITVQLGDSSFLHKESYDTLAAVWGYVKEGGVFNRKKFLELQLSFADTSRHIFGLKAYRKALPAPKRIAIGIQAGYGFQSGIRPAPYIGVGISYNFIRL